MRINRPRWIALLVLVTAAAAWLWAHEGHEPLPTRGARLVKDRDHQVVGVLLFREAVDALGLTTAPVERRRMDHRILAQARLEAPWRHHAFATSRLAGRVVRLHARAGQVVEAGQVLAEVHAALLESLQLELLTARNEAQLSGRQVEALGRAARNGSVPEQALIDARARHRQDRNRLDVARSKWFSLGLARGDLEGLLERSRLVAALPVRSPVRGTVIHADVSVGKVVEPAEHLFEVVDLSRVWVRIGVLERDLSRVREGLEVELSLTAYPGEVVRTRVTVVGPHLDARTHLVTAWATLTNPPGGEPRFLPGMQGLARLVVPGEEGATAVPESALIHDGVESYVLVEQASTAEGSELVKVPVVVGARAGGWVEVRGGNVFPGSYVVTRGGHELSGFFVPGVLRPGPEALRDMGVAVEHVGRHVVERVRTVEGVVDFPPNRRAVLSAQLAGTLQQVLVEPGQYVRPGQEVARLAGLELQTLQLDLLRAHLDAEVVDARLGWLRSATTSVPERLVWEAQSKLGTLRRQRDAARRILAGLGLSRTQLDDLTGKKQLVDALPVRSPIAGRVVALDRVLGQALRADEILFEVHDPATALVQAFLSEADLAWLQPGGKARVRLTADPAAVVEGTVERTARLFAEQTLSAWVRLEAPRGRLLHNQQATVTLRRPGPEVLAVPLAAIVRDAARSFVFVRQASGTFERRAVELGEADDRRVEVRSGLKEGEVVAVAGTAALQTAHASVR